MGKQDATHILACMLRYVYPKPTLVILHNMYMFIMRIYTLRTSNIGVDFKPNLDHLQVQF